MIKFFIGLVSFFYISTSFALSFSPPASSEGAITISDSAQIIYISNDSSSSVSMNLSISQSGLEKFVDRCSGISLPPSSSCYITLLVKSSQGSFSTELQNNGSRIADLVFSRSAPSQSSSFSISSLSLNDFLYKEIFIKNQTSSSKSYSPSLSGTDASRYQISVNRCQNVSPGKSCSVILKLKPQQNGSYSASLSEAQVSGSVSLSSTISSVSPPLALNSSLSLSLSSSSLNFGTITKFGYSGSQNVIVSNVGNTLLSPIVTPSSHVKIILNRCLSLKPGASCSITLALNTNSSMGYSGSISQQLSVKASSLSLPQLVSISGTLAIPNDCTSNQHFTGSACEDNVMSCSDLSNGIASGTKTWGGSSFGSCLASNSSACFPGYNFSAGSCSLANASVLEMKYEPSEDLLAIPNQTIYYTNNGNFGRAMMKFTLTQKSYVNSLDIKVNSMSGMGFAVSRVISPSETGLDGHITLRYFDNTQSGSGLKHFAFNDSGLLLEAGDYYIVDMTGYYGGSYTLPLYYSPPNVSFSIYGQECTFNYGPCVYNGGVYTPFNVPPQNYAPYFKVNTTAWIPPANSQNFAFSPTLKDSTLSLSSSNSVMSSSGSPIISWGYINKYIDVTAGGKYYVEFKFSSPYYAYIGGNFLNSDPNQFYNGGYACD